MTKLEVKKALLVLYKDFVGYVCETNPGYTDNDFNFDAFMDYLSIEEDEQLS